MLSGFDRLWGLRDDGLDYLRLRWASLRLDVVDRLSAGLSKATGYAVLIFFVLLALTFMMVALALWIGEMLGHPSLGFLIAGGGFLLLGILLFFVTDSLVRGSMVRYFVDLFFTDKDDDHELRQQ